MAVSPNTPTVDRCVCMDVSFRELLDYAHRHDVDFRALQRRFSCGRGCGLCIPYIHRALETNNPRVPIDDIPSATA